MRLTYRQGYSYDPKAACCGDTIHLVWWEGYVDSGIHEEVFYKRSTDAGETWGADTLLSVEDTQVSALPQIAVTGNTVHVVWFEDDFGVLYRRSNDGGSTWAGIDSIIPGMGYSSIQATGDTVYIAGIIGSLGVLRFIKSFNGGNNWEPIQTIVPAHDSPTLRKKLNNTSGIVISYEYIPEIYSVRSFDCGETWLGPQLISEGIASGSQMPAMDTDDSAGIHITWYDYKYSPYAWTGDIFYRASRDSGNTWEPIDSMTVMHRAVASDILAEGNNLHLVWEDDRNGFNNNFEIYYRMSPDLGQTWGSEMRLTNAINWSRHPSQACAGQYLHLFWFDLRDDPSNIVGEIYYKRKDLSWVIEEVDKVSALPRLKVEVYPNPFRDLLNFKFQIPIRHTVWRTKQIPDSKLQAIMRIYDISGKEVVSNSITYEPKPYTIDMQDLPMGVYFIRVELDSMYGIRKIIKVK